MPISDLRQLLFERASSTPDKIAYTFIQDSGIPVSITYHQLYQGAQRIATILALEPSGAQRALLIYPPGFDFLFALFGCFLSGKQAIPIALPRPKTRDLFNHFINHANPQWVLTHSSLADRIQPLMQAKNNAIKLVCSDTLNPVTTVNTSISPKTNIAFIQYTSGTTTLPKGVLVSYENLNHNLQAIKSHFHLTSESVCYSWLPHYHDMGLIDGLLTPIFNNCLGILSSPLYVVSNPNHWVEVITDYRVNHTGGPNFFFDLCVEKVSKDSLSRIDLRSLTHLYVSAESVRQKTLENFTNLFSICGFRKDLFTPGYGLAEATLMVTCKKLNRPVQRVVKNENEYVGLGSPIPGMQIKILDQSKTSPVNPGKVGEICVAGASLTPGYFNDESATMNSRVTIEGQPYFKTGDLGFVEQGELFVVGRINDTLHIRGSKYQPEDLEYIIAQSHPLLAGTPCAVVAIEQELEKIIVLQEVKRTITDAGILLSIKHAIAQAIYLSFGLSVFDIKLLPYGSLHKTTSGKVKRQENRRLYEKGLLNVL